jgi:hypothetical protein
MPSGALGSGEKLERLFRMSLDDLYEILSRPIDELDPVRLSVRMQVARRRHLPKGSARRQTRPRGCS